MRSVMTFSLHSASISRILEPSPQGLISSSYTIIDTMIFKVCIELRTKHFIRIIIFSKALDTLEFRTYVDQIWLTSNPMDVSLVTWHAFIERVCAAVVHKLCTHWCIIFPEYPFELLTPLRFHELFKFKTSFLKEENS